MPVPRYRRIVLRGVPTLLGVAGVFAAGCDRVEPFPPLSGVKRIVVIRDSKDTLALITDSARLHAVERFVNQRPDGWSQPAMGVPVARVVANVYTDQFERGFGYGDGFFEQYREAGTWSTRATSPPEIAEFQRVLGIAEKTSR
jgi:hypothetical protein